MSILLPTQAMYIYIFIKVTGETVVINGFGLYAGIFTVLLSVLESSSKDTQDADKEYEYDVFPLAEEFLLLQDSVKPFLQPPLPPPHTHACVHEAKVGFWLQTDPALTSVLH